MPTPVPYINIARRVIERRTARAEDLTDAQVRELYAALPPDAPELKEPTPHDTDTGHDDAADDTTEERADDDA